MNEQLQTHRPTLKSLVESPAYSNGFRRVLGERAPQFVSSLIQISGSHALRECDPHSVIAAGMTAAALDLPINPNLGFAFIIPYAGKASFQCGYKGFVQLANRSGLYRRLNVTVVYEGELLKFDRVKADVVIDESKRTSDKVVGYVAYFELTNGHEHAEYWPIEAVEKHAQRFSQAFRAKKKDSPWFTDFDAMAKKTVLKSLISHWGPMTVQLQMAVSDDGAAKASVDADPVFPDAPERQQVTDGKAELVGDDPGTPKQSPQSILADRVVGMGHTFTTFQQFGLTSGQVPNVDSLAEFAQVPDAVCKRLAKWTDIALKQALDKEGK